MISSLAVEPPSGRPSRSRRLKGLGLVVLGVVLGMVLSVALAVAARWPRFEVVYRSDQPATVTYGDDSKHLLGLVRRSTLLGETHLIVVGRDPGFSYGHLVGIETSAGTVRTTEWTTAGVRVAFDTGHELFIPARYFIGGR
ncbi:hypothetical protein [Streptosporangium pseudovulgare]|uniref:Uncharacterized protein n=1 Tax=Streptosporangium pseudovulgare TaxID=35765 RepID=A0ABQ2RJV0_9ACTN|nr:hypothetical protein [Streptosporangium pseudovulgare]GGQ29363.1 hypothetical protein GCM10010140_69400 [Streptosporangium pseudovulgare]